MIAILSLWDNHTEKIQQIKDNIENVEFILILGGPEADLASLAKHWDDILDISYQHNIRIEYICGGHPDNKEFLNLNDHRLKNVNRIFWPTYFFLHAYSRIKTVFIKKTGNFLGYDIDDVNTGYDVTNFNYPFIIMNKAPKWHRAMFMDQLAKLDLIDKGAVVWRESSNYNYKYWKEKLMYLDQHPTDNFLFNQETLPKEYAESFIQIVTESHDNCFYITEKTVTPMFFNKPFLVVSCKNFHKTLVSLGFKLYEELFDYSFDDIDNVEDRYEMIAKQVVPYSLKNKEELEELYMSIFDKLVYNKNLAIKYATDTLTFPKVWNELAVEELKDNSNFVVNPYYANNLKYVIY